MQTRKPRTKRMTGVRAAAVSLGVSAGHLSRVLRGKRVSRSLTARYQAWSKKRKGGA